MRDFNGNSTDNNKEEHLKINAKPSTVQGSSGFKKRNHFTNFVSKFIMTDSDTVRSSVINDVIIPGAKDILFKAGKSALDMWLYGSVRPDNKDNNYTRIRNYSSNNNNSSSTRTEEIMRNRNLSGQKKISDWNTDFKPKADSALEEMKALLKEYGYASIADFLTIVDKPNDISFTDYDFGWKGANGLDDATVIRGGNGYYILFPKVTQLK